MIELTARQKKKLKEIAKKYKLELILLFGSRATDNFRKDSDYDIAYLSSSPSYLNGNKKEKLKSELVSLCGIEDFRMFDIEIDNPLFLREVFRNPKILFCSNIKKFFSYEIYAIKIYADYQCKIRTNTKMSLVS